MGPQRNDTLKTMQQQAKDEARETRTEEQGRVDEAIEYALSSLHIGIV